MPTVDEIMQQLKKLGSAQTVKTFSRHGAPADTMYGVKVGDLKPIAKKLKGEQQLAMQLYATGNSDAMYLAGLIADGAKMTAKEIESWAKGATWYMIGEYTVPWVASENPKGTSIAKKWIGSKTPKIAASGWATYSSIVGTREDSELDLAEIKSLLKKVEKEIHAAPNRVKYTMNNFVISVGCFVKPLLADAKAVAKSIGVVEVDVGDTSCTVPLATDYIAKVEKMKRIGKKRKQAKC